jgi:AcrR family transcriptional regulator
MSEDVVVESAARRARRRVREDLVREIVEAARRQLVTQGAAALSLRAVARELGMVSSAVYRYVASRDELLTLLIIDAYNSLGAAAERAESKVDRADLTGRFQAICHAARRWALKHPHEYALIYGSPVPGYAAPQETIGPATRVPTLLAALLAQARADGVVGPATVSARTAPDRAVPARTVPDDEPGLRRALGPVRTVIPEHVPDDRVLRGIMAWTYLFGAISFELFGHLHNVVADGAAARDTFFDAELVRIGVLLGLSPS